MKIRDVIIEQHIIKLGDSFDIELGNLVIETGIVGFMPDGVIVEADEKAMALLNVSGALFESVNLNEANYYNPMDYERDQQRQMDLSKREFKRQELQHELGHEDDPDFERKLRQQQMDRDRGPWYIKIDGKIYSQKGQPKVFDWKNGANNYALAIIKNRPELQGKILLTKNPADDKTDIEESRMAEVDMIFRDLASGDKDIYQVLTNPQGAEEAYVSEKLQDMYDNASIDFRLHPDDDFEQIIDIIADQLAEEYLTDDPDQVYNEAKYQGREVSLGKPMQGDVKKSKVYVRGPKGNVVKVNFGDKKMKIKKSNPKRRKSFRARHNCANPGPRWKARYWSCRAW
jgi:hypothetical protein